MIAQREFIKRLIALLDKAGIPYMVAGSQQTGMDERT
jgi:hypothetical protein